MRQSLRLARLTLAEALFVKTSSFLVGSLDSINKSSITISPSHHLLPCQLSPDLSCATPRAQFNFRLVPQALVPPFQLRPRPPTQLLRPFQGR